MTIEALYAQVLSFYFCTNHFLLPFFFPPAQLRSTNGTERVTMETKRWGLSKGARRELLGVETLGFLERNTTTTTSRNRSGETQRDLTGWGAPEEEKKKEGQQEKKKKRSKIEQQISPALFDTRTQQPTTQDRHTQQLHTHTGARKERLLR